MISTLHRAKPAIVGAGVIWLVTHLLLTAVGLAANAAVPGRTWFSVGGSFFQLFAQWDTEHFLQIAQHGYFDPSTEQKVQAFFPGYPVLAQWVAWVLGLGNPTELTYYIALWLIPLVASLVAGIMVWLLTEHLYDLRTARTATVLFFAGPYSVFLLASYSEALFLALAVAAYFAASQDRWLAAGLLTGLASFVRINSVFLLAALGVMYLVRCKTQGKRVFRPQLWYLALGLVGTAAYFLFLYAGTGSWNAWSEAQYLGWKREFTLPWQTLRSTVGIFLSDRYSFDNRLQFGLDLVFALLIVIMLAYMLRKKMWPEATYVGLTAASMMTSMTYMSLARNTLTLFPMLIVIAALIVKARARGPWGAVVYWVVLAASFALMLVNTWLLALGFWVD